MTETILAVYEEGVLKPLEPLHLKEQQVVYIQVVPEEKKDEGAAAIRVLVEAGLMRPPDREIPPPPDPVSKEERLRLADLLGRAPGKQLSEIIIKDRGEW